MKTKHEKKQKKPMLKSQHFQLESLYAEEIETLIFEEGNPEKQKVMQKVLEQKQLEGLHVLASIWKLTEKETDAFAGIICILDYNKEYMEATYRCFMEQKYQTENYIEEVLSAILSWAYSVQDEYYFSLLKVEDVGLSEAACEKMGAGKYEYEEGWLVIEKVRSAGISFGMAIGMCFGVALKGLFGSYAAGLGVGLLIGIAMGVSFDNADKKKRKQAIDAKKTAYGIPLEAQHTKME